MMARVEKRGIRESRSGRDDEKRWIEKRAGTVGRGEEWREKTAEVSGAAIDRSRRPRDFRRRARELGGCRRTSRSLKTKNSPPL
jgi:hypothetical protein